MKSSSSKKFISYLFLSIITISIIVVLYKSGMPRIESYLDNENDITPLLIFILRFTSIIIPALPSTIYSLLAGSILGLKKGLLVIYISDICACSACFYITRRYGKSLANRVIGYKKLKKLEEFSKNKLEDNFLLIIGSLMTGLFDFISYGLGFTSISWKNFLICLIISVVLSDLPIVAMGAGILNGGKMYLIIAIVGIIVLSCLSSKLNLRSHLKN